MMPEILPRGYEVNSTVRFEIRDWQGLPVFCIWEVAGRYFVREHDLLRSRWLEHRMFKDADDAWRYIDQIWAGHWGIDD